MVSIKKWTLTGGVRVVTQVTILRAADDASAFMPFNKDVLPRGLSPLTISSRELNFIKSVKCPVVLYHSLGWGGGRAYSLRREILDPKTC